MTATDIFDTLLKLKNIFFEIFSQVLISLWSSWTSLLLLLLPLPQLDAVNQSWELNIYQELDEVCRMTRVTQCEKCEEFK